MLMYAAHASSGGVDGPSVGPVEGRRGLELPPQPEQPKVLVFLNFPNTRLFVVCCFWKKGKFSKRETASKTVSMSPTAALTARYRRLVQHTQVLIATQI